MCSPLLKSHPSLTTATPLKVCSGGPELMSFIIPASETRAPGLVKHLYLYATDAIVLSESRFIPNSCILKVIAPAFQHTTTGRHEMMVVSNTVEIQLASVIHQYLPLLFTSERGSVGSVISKICSCLLFTR